MASCDPHRRCDGVRRRDILRVGSLAAFGIGLPDLFRGRQATADSRDGETLPVRARQAILIWLDGGPSHLDTFDLKPEAPAEVRGPFSPVSTAVPGTQICELLPETARLLDQIAIVRSVTSPLGEHNFGAHYLMTGQKPTPVLESAYYGSVLAHVRPRQGVLPDNVAVPDFRVGGSMLRGNGFLPSSVQPFAVQGDPARPDFQVRHVDLSDGMTFARVNRRREFLNAIDGLSRTVESSKAPADPHFEQAYRLIAAPEAKRAFDLSKEPADVRRRYGLRTIGQSCLLARRLIERGVSFVTVNNRGWDTHQNLYTQLKEGYTGAKTPVGLIPSFDLAFSALVKDLSERGLLEETLVVAMGEFGRTPKWNTAGGRDHWPRVFSVALAGGGIRGGQVVGRSDAVGENPAERPVTPADLASTIYTLLGIDPNRELHTSDGRPVRVSAEGTAISELIG